MSYKLQILNTIYKRQWMRDRRMMFLADKKCLTCGSTKGLFIVWNQKAKGRRNFSSTPLKIEERIGNAKIYCREHFNEHVRRARKTQLVHGTLRGYKTHKCRCRPCTDASTKHWREYRKAKAKRLKEVALVKLDAALAKLHIDPSKLR